MAEKYYGVHEYVEVEALANGFVLLDIGNDENTTGHVIELTPAVARRVAALLTAAADEAEES